MLADRVTNACGGLLRYSQPHCEEIVRVMELLEEVNDNLCNARDPSCNVEALDEIHQLVTALRRLGEVA